MAPVTGVTANLGMLARGRRVDHAIAAGELVADQVVGEVHGRRRP